MALEAYKHIFTSPSSVEKEPKATRSGNARIHGMTQVTSASIAYVATQVGAVFATFVRHSDTPNITTGSVCTVILACFLPNGHSDRLRKILQLRRGPF
jgi:hypothetical protein